MGWHMKRGLAADVPIFAAALIVFGGVIAVVLRGVVDVALHCHRSTERPKCDG